MDLLMPFLQCFIKILFTSRCANKVYGNEELNSFMKHFSVDYIGSPKKVGTLEYLGKSKYL